MWVERTSDFGGPKTSAVSGSRLAGFISRCVLLSEHVLLAFLHGLAIMTSDQ